MEKFLDAAARGDMSQVSTLLSHVPSLINQTGYSGWTALMLAARNGHSHVVEKLLSHGYITAFLLICNVINVPFALNNTKEIYIVEYLFKAALIIFSI